MLRTVFQEAGYLDTSLFAILNEDSFTPDTWTTLDLLGIYRPIDLVRRLPEANRDSGLNTHSSVIFEELKSFLEENGYPMSPDQIQISDDKVRREIGSITCDQKKGHLVGLNSFDFNIEIQSVTCETAPESLWHTRLTLENTSFRQKTELLLRAGDKAMLTGLVPPLQIEHQGFQDKTAIIQFRSQALMNLIIP